MSKIIPSDLLAIRNQFAYVFRSDLEKISTFLEFHLTTEVLESDLLNSKLIDNLWEVGLIRVRECVLQYNDIDKAYKLLTMFNHYQHTFSKQVQECYKSCSESVTKHINLNHINYTHDTSSTEDSQIESTISGESFSSVEFIE